MIAETTSALSAEEGPFEGIRRLLSNEKPAVIYRGAVNILARSAREARNYIRSLGGDCVEVNNTAKESGCDDKKTYIQSGSTQIDIQEQRISTSRSGLNPSCFLRETMLNANENKMLTL